MSAGKIHPAELGFDFDGVIADTVEAFIRIACEQYNYCGIRPDDITDFSVEQCLDMEAGIAESIFLQILRDSVGTGLLPMPGGAIFSAPMVQKAAEDPENHWVPDYGPDEAGRLRRPWGMNETPTRTVHQIGRAHV